MAWKYYPKSPFGDVDICDHGCTRSHGSTIPICVFCDYPMNANLKLSNCSKCKSITWHLEGKCLRCEESKDR
jgi:hypothetical protein